MLCVKRNLQQPLRMANPHQDSDDHAEQAQEHLPLEGGCCIERFGHVLQHSDMLCKVVDEIQYHQKCDSSGKGKCIIDSW